MTAGLVGHIAGLWRYPVKSMAGEALPSVEVSWHGLAGDRRWAFIRDGLVNSGFPWLTLRERSEMSAYRPSFVDPGKPDKSATRVRTPHGAEFDVTDPALAAGLWPQGTTLLRQDRGVFDTLPLSLISTRTIADLGASVGADLDVRRFRPNFLLEPAGDAPFPEDEWLGRVLRIGELRMRIDKRDGRCVAITIDPDTFERNPEVLRRVGRDRGGCLGVYGSTVTPGRVALGDAVHLE